MYKLLLKLVGEIILGAKKYNTPLRDCLALVCDRYVIGEMNPGLTGNSKITYQLVCVRRIEEIIDNIHI
jgi:hypothetical protein